MSWTTTSLLVGQIRNENQRVNVVRVIMFSGKLFTFDVLFKS